jgi:hypothetical protein
LVAVAVVESDRLTLPSGCHGIVPRSIRGKLDSLIVHRIAGNARRYTMLPALLTEAQAVASASFLR